MKRRLTKLVVFLLLGAIVNVAVAWACAAWSDHRNIYYFLIMQPVQPSQWPRSEMNWLTQSGWAPSKNGWHAVPTEPLSALGLHRRAFYELPSAPSGWSGPREPFVIRTRAGWPARSLTGAIWFRDVVRARSQSFPRGKKIEAVNALAIEIDIHTQPKGFTWKEHRALPYMPIVPGFAINTIFYAALLWLLTLAPSPRAE